MKKREKRKRKAFKKRIKKRRQHIIDEE